MVTADIVVIVAYLAGVAALGWWAGRSQKARSTADFFLGGRTLPWWLLGTSMVATTLAADTPLTVAGLTIEKGVAGNWIWWSMAVSHVLVAVVLGPLWRRAAVVTDAEFCELRYTGRTAAALRACKAFFFAVPINAIVLGWVFRAMIKISAELLPGVPVWQVLAALLLVTLAYSLRSGFQGVVLTDLVQFPIALGGAVVLAWVAVDQAGGLDAVVEAAAARGGPDALALLPTESAVLPWHTLGAFLCMQWWAQKNADGGGIFIQRLLSARSEVDAERGGLWFCVAHYILRPWPWILAGLAAVVLVPDAVAADPESAYGALIRKVLPAGLRGLLVASFLAAFMSTVDTHLNWGASYVVNDLVGRRRPVSPERMPVVTRLAVLAMAVVAVGAALAIDSIAGAWEFLIAFGAGAGAVVLLRWFWWRITAAAELTAMFASTVLSTAIYLLAPEEPYAVKLGTVVLGSAALWIPVAWRTAPAPESLVRFYERVRPPGPGWRSVARAAGAPPPPPLAPLLVRWLVALAGVMAALLGIGRAFLHDGPSGLAIAGAGALLLVGVVSASDRGRSG